MRNNSKEAKGKGFPLRITATEIRVEENNTEVTEPQIEFVKNMLSRLDWPALVKVRHVVKKRFFCAGMSSVGVLEIQNIGI